MKKGKALKSDKGSGCGLCYGQIILEGTLLRMIGINFDDELGRAISERIFYVILTERRMLRRIFRPKRDEMTGG